MPSHPKNYVRYFPTPKAAEAWGVAVTAAGRSHIAAGRHYPVGEHPASHALNWERGRILDALQVVLISEGRGLFESATTKLQPIEAGSAFMLFPGEWHRYRPEPATGWHESWVELTGSTVARLMRTGAFSPKRPLLTSDHTQRSGVSAALEAVHARAQSSRGGLDAELAARGFATLAAWQEAQTAPQRRTRLAQAVATAERILAERSHESVNIEALARELGVAYSHFRHAFSEHTGFAPWQYVLHVRLTKSKRLLTHTDATLDEIAGQLGFSSAFHFSAAFKRTFNVSPTHWRKLT